MKAAHVYILILFAAVAGAQDEGTVKSDAIIDGLIGDGVTRAILVRERPSPAGMSIDLTIEFEFDSSDLTNESRGQLTQLQQALVHEQVQRYAFKIVGHTDAKGDADYNQRLSLARATEVRDFLIKHGVTPERLSVDGRGENEPVYPHLPEHAHNRRVQIINLGEISE